MLRQKISAIGLEVDQAKISMIITLLPPSNVKEVRSFLGLRNFIEDSSRTSPRE